MKTKTIALTAVAALALPAAAAQAGKPEEPGKQGRDTAAAKQEAAKERGAEQKAREKKAKKPKGKGFTLKGAGLTGALPVADGALTGTLTLDPKSANKHARTLLDLSKADLRGTATSTFGETGDEVLVKYVGLSSTDALEASDRVKVVGRVTDGTLDIRRIMVKRESAEDETTEDEGTASQS